MHASRFVYDTDGTLGDIWSQDELHVRRPSVTAGCRTVGELVKSPIRLIEKRVNQLESQLHVRLLLQSFNGLDSHTARVIFISVCYLRSPTESSRKQKTHTC